MATADTDVGIAKSTNQDSILIKHASTDDGEVLLAVVCDGMGGLAKGELASATVIRAFSDWFDDVLPFELLHPDLQVIGSKWALMLKDLNATIGDYGATFGGSLGTTFTGVLFVNDQYVVAHVGDTRLYQIGNRMNQLTTDQTFVAREIAKGNMTPEEAKKDKRRNLLLQCVGASKNVEPQLIFGTAEPGGYMLCCDGFRHEITEEEMYAALRPDRMTGKAAMHQSAKYLIELVKSRKERDNISVILIKAE